MDSVHRATESLASLGVTRTEATAYLELLTRGPGTGYDVARRTGVARANIYSALEALAGKGLVERSESAPVAFTAVPAAGAAARLAAGYAHALDRFEEALEALQEEPQASQQLLERFNGRAAARAAVERVAARADSRVVARIPKDGLRSFDPMIRGLARRGITLDVEPSPNPTMGYVLVDQNWAVTWLLDAQGLWGDDSLLLALVGQLLTSKGGSAG